MYTRTPSLPGTYDEYMYSYYKPISETCILGTAKPPTSRPLDFDAIFARTAAARKAPTPASTRTIGGEVSVRDAANAAGIAAAGESRSLCTLNSIQVYKRSRQQVRICNPSLCTSIRVY